IKKATATAGYSEDYYYEGVRRIQEQFSSGDKKDYIYGPGYIEEFIAQIDITGSSQKITYMLQDANYNVVALVDSSGTVKEQYTYDPYGTLAAMDTFGTGVPVNRVGHQGLFFENFNIGGLSTTAVGLYYNRNRWYSPSLGRFMQRDPNEAGMPIMTACAMNGDIMQLVAHLSIEGQYGDGMNLYQYCGSNPVNSRDSSGLFITAITYMVVFGFGCFFGRGIANGDKFTVPAVIQEFVFGLATSIIGELVIPDIQKLFKGEGPITLSKVKEAVKLIVKGIVPKFKTIVMPETWGILLRMVVRTMMGFIAAFILGVVVGWVFTMLYKAFVYCLDAVCNSLAGFFDNIISSAGKMAANICAGVIIAAADYRSRVDALMDDISNGRW
ncbi:MAG: RHS repeat-associated core domain-containing protein, partial [Euryarchaeota archaeon]|nr:RHS repeat-associated core domain-containing protein [Euryarchaeota archaeon]